jgi:Fungal protein of unknown function (DUF1748).
MDTLSIKLTSKLQFFIDRMTREELKEWITEYLHEGHWVWTTEVPVSDVCRIRLSVFGGNILAS